MIRGAVNAQLEATVRLRVRGPGGAETDLEATIDTGFSASLTLPAGTIAALGLIRRMRTRAVLADGTVRWYSLYDAEVEWVGGWTPVLVSGVGDDVLIGMTLLSGHELRVAVEVGGTIEISAIP